MGDQLGSHDRHFKVGDRVLFLLPTSHNKLLLQWKEPYGVVDKQNRMDYVMDQDGHRRIYHANLLRREREVIPEDEASVAVVEEEDHDDELP